MGYQSEAILSKGKRDLEIIGTEQLWKQFELLHNMGAKTHNFKSAFTRAAKPMKNAARMNAKRLTASGGRISTTRYTKRGNIAKTKRTYGPIWKSITLKTSKKYKGVFWLGPTRGRTARFDAWYAYFQELGTTRGISGKYFMRQAYEKNYQRTRNLIGIELYKEMYKIAAKKLSA